MANISKLATAKQVHDVVVYGATGYTGQLTCEFLAKLGVPFTASGRNQARLDELVAQWRADGAHCSAVAVPHTQEGLRGLFKHAKVVINISGPFLLLGEAVVEAALASNCHYIDSTGEQEFMLDVKRKFGDRFRGKGLLLSPSVSFLFGPGTMGAELCVESSGIHDIEVIYAPPSLQTMASLQSMWRTVIRDNSSIVRGKLQKIDGIGVIKRKLPDGTQRKAVCIGTSEATYLMDDRRVHNCEVYFASNDLARAVPVFRFWKFLTRFISRDALDRWSDKLIETFKKNPGREEPESGRFVITVTGKGPGGTVEVVMNGTSPYMLTGFLCAVAAQTLLQGKPLATGFASMSKAFGADYLIKRLEEAGTFTTIKRHVAGGAQRPANTRRHAG